MVENIEITMKIPRTLYEGYKALCKQRRILPAIDMKRYMAEMIAKSSMDEILDTKVFEKSGLRILTMNLHTYTSKSYELPYEKDETMRMNELGNSILSYDPDAALLNEFMPGARRGDIIVEILEKSGYNLFYPKGYDATKDKRKWCITILAVKKGIDFAQSFLPSSLYYRYISGTLISKEDKKIAVLGVHIPNVEDANNNRQMERKQELYALVNDFTACIKEGSSAVLLGDFNTDKAGVCCKELERLQTYWDDIMEDIPTWESSRLDYIFCNPAMTESHKVKSFISSLEQENGLTDHKVLVADFA